MDSSPQCRDELTAIQGECAGQGEDLTLAGGASRATHSGHQSRVDSDPVALTAPGTGPSPVFSTQVLATTTMRRLPRDSGSPSPP